MVHGLPKGTRQAACGLYVRDVFYEEYALLAELDGRPGHEGTGAFRDMVGDNWALLAGEVTLRFGWPDVAGDPCGAARLVATVLRQRGWRGEFQVCRREWPSTLQS